MTNIPKDIEYYKNLVKKYETETWFQSMSEDSKMDFLNFVEKQTNLKMIDEIQSKKDDLQKGLKSSLKGDKIKDINIFSNIMQKGDFDFVLEESKETGIECNFLEASYFPGILKNGVWESVDSTDKETFLLGITYYSNDLYTVFTRNCIENCKENYNEETIKHLSQITRDRGISFPNIDNELLTGTYKNSISKLLCNEMSLNKEELMKFLKDLKFNKVKLPS